MEKVAPAFRGSISRRFTILFVHFLAFVAVVGALSVYKANRIARLHTEIGELATHIEVLDRLETAIFRIAQEALTNVARHARVHEVTVRLWVDAERVGLQVADRGAGMDADAALTTRSSTGLAGMKERAELLGGEFTLESKTGQGTRLTVELPLNAGGAP